MYRSRRDVQLGQSQKRERLRTQFSRSTRGARLSKALLKLPAADYDELLANATNLALTSNSLETIMY